MNELLYPGLVIVVGIWVRWYYLLLRISSFRRDRVLSLVAGCAPPVCLATLLPVLTRWSSPDVRTDRAAILFYMALDALWLRLDLFLLSLTGLSMREDVVERRNRAATWTICGALAGATFCFAGSNIGKGPGPQVVIFCAALSTAGLMALWLCLERLLRFADSITIERNEGAGIRVSGWFAATGLILGSAVAGDWKSVEGTVRDFVRFGWGAMPLLLMATLLEGYFRQRKNGLTANLKVSLGTAGGYLLAAGAYVRWLRVH